MKIFNESRIVERNGAFYEVTIEAYPTSVNEGLIDKIKERRANKKQMKEEQIKKYVAVSGKAMSGFESAIKKYVSSSEFKHVKVRTVHLEKPNYYDAIEIYNLRDIIKSPKYQEHKDFIAGLNKICDSKYDNCYLKLVDKSTKQEDGYLYYELVLR